MSNNAIRHNCCKHTASASGENEYANSRLGIVAYFSKIEIVKSEQHFQQGIKINYSREFNFGLFCSNRPPWALLGS